MRHKLKTEWWDVITHYQMCNEGHFSQFTVKILILVVLMFAELMCCNPLESSSVTSAGGKSGSSPRNL